MIWYQIMQSVVGTLDDDRASSLALAIDLGAWRQEELLWRDL